MNQKIQKPHHAVLRPINVLTISIPIGFALFLLWIGNERFKDYLLSNKAEADNASTDSLTGLHNRRYFDAQIKREFNRALRTGQKLSLLVFDIDYFKQYNDYYGHQKGDACLQIIAELMTPWPDMEVRSS